LFRKLSLEVFFHLINIFHCLHSINCGLL
jgi:hypothetical protein